MENIKLSLTENSNSGEHTGKSPQALTHRAKRSSRKKGTKLKQILELESIQNERENVTEGTNSKTQGSKTGSANRATGANKGLRRGICSATVGVIRPNRLEKPKQ